MALWRARTSAKAQQPPYETTFTVYLQDPDFYLDPHKVANTPIFIYSLPFEEHGKRYS